MQIITNHYKVSEGQRIKLSSVDTKPHEDFDKKESEALLASLKTEMFELQEKLYAENKHSLLLIFQAMDAAGKDSAIEHVMSGLNPQGCQVFSFKQPTSEELDHDFLWRHYKALPERGRMGIHNRSHYENVLICKVHPSFAANESQTPVELIDDEFWNRRYRSIRQFEEHLKDNKTTVVKFFLHVSKEEQKKRFLERIEDPSKNWKFSAADLDERKLWPKYMEAYEDAISETSTLDSPWFIIPADKKWFARTAICQVIVEKIKEINPKYPELLPEEIKNLELSRQQLIEDNSTT